MTNQDESNELNNEDSRRGSPHYGLRGRSVRAGTAAVAGQVGASAINLVTTIILARILTPIDFGLVAMVMIIIGLSSTISDFGLSAVTVRHDHIDRAQVSKLFWFNTIAGLFSSLVILAAAPAIAWMYDDPRLQTCALALAVLAFLDGVSIQHRALMRRQLRHGTLAAIDIVSLFAGSLAAVYLAWEGSGYWALVAMYIIRLGAKSALVWLAAGWTPISLGGITDIFPMLRYGGQITGARLLDYISRTVDKLLIGVLRSAHELGIYAKAYSGMLLPFERVLSELHYVAVPTLSRLESDPGNFSSYYRKALLLVVTAGIPLIALLAVEARTVVLLLLGSQWLAAIPVLQLLAPLAIAHLFATTTYWVYESVGNPGRMFKWRLFDTSVRVLSLLIGMHWGLAGISLCLSASSTLLVVPGLRYCFKGSVLHVRDVASTVWRPFVAATCATLSVLTLRSVHLIDTNLVAEAGIDVMAFFVTYLVTWSVLPNGRATLVELFRLTSDLRGRADLYRPSTF